MRPAELVAAIEALDLRQEALQTEQAAAERRAHTDPTVRQLRQRRAGLETAAQQLASRVRQLELEVAELAGRAQAHERAIYDGSVRHPADLQRRQHELETIRAKVAVMEESELTELEAQERTTAELAGVTQELAEREQEVERVRAGDRRQAPELAEELTALTAERQRLAEQLAPAQLRTYERTAARQRPAVARVVAGACSGCRLPLAARLVHEARGEQLITCENCQRILLT